MAYYTDSFKHPTYVMIMIMVCGFTRISHELCEALSPEWAPSTLLSLVSNWDNSCHSRDLWENDLQVLVLSAPQLSRDQS